MRSLGAAAIILAVALSGSLARARDGAVVVASKIDTEGALLGNMILALLRAHGLAVENKLQLGPTNIVRADTLGGAQGIDVTNAIDAKLAAIRATLPIGYRIEVGGAVENSANSALSTGSRLSSSMASLGDRVKTLQQQQSAVVATAEKLGDSLVGSANWNRMVLDAYLKN